jgi:putative flavoprotein involved in K+ transport
MSDHAAGGFAMTSEHPAAEERVEADQAPVDVAVVGGGQAGLAIGRLLAQQGRRLAILEAGPAVGSSWRGRWDSLVLFTPRRYDALPGMAFPGEPDGYPDRDEVVAYLEAYARRFELPVMTDRPVRTLRAREGGGFVLESERGDVRAAQVVVATGPFQAPHTPAFAAGLDPDVLQIHSTGYRRPSDVPAGSVLVVGGGNTGFQIAEDLAPTHDVTLAIGSRQTPLPQRLLGRDLFWWLTRTGLLAKSVDSRIGRRARGRDTLIGSSRRRLRRRGVTLRPRVVGAGGRTVTFADGDAATPDAIVWATGFRPDHSWIDLPVTDGDGRLRHRRGVTDVPGLYFLGLSWQHTRGSALLGFLEDDARFIAARVDEHARSRPRAARATAPHTEA